MKHYYINIVKDWPLRLAAMQVTPMEFSERQSPFKIFCPCCLHFENVLTSGGDPPDRTGLVQFRLKFYWLCQEHIELFLKTPEMFLPPFVSKSLPEDLPTQLTLNSKPENVAHDGNCVVCYKKHRCFIEGNIAHSVSYCNRVFLFESLECMTEFMKKPHLFMFEIRFRPDQNYPSLDYNALPILGMLEQFVATPIIKALSFITRRRPIIPGLSISASAAIGIGLYLKVYHAKLQVECKHYYIDADNLYHERRKKLLQYLKNMHSVVNPFLYYEEPLPEFKLEESDISRSSFTSLTAVSKTFDDLIGTDNN